MARKCTLDRSSQRGSSIIEFLVICMTLLFLMFAGIEMDRLLMVYTNLADVARAATRYAAVHGADNSVSTTTIQGYVTNRAMGINTGLLAVTVTYPDSGSTAIGSRVKVSVSYPYDPWFNLLPSGFASLNVKASSEGTITW
jgi:Flp pilus assembly protein TadG